LDTLLDHISNDTEDAESLAYQFEFLEPEACLLLPRLRRMALAHLPGSRLAAVRAIGALHESAAIAFPDLRRVFSGAAEDSLLRLRWMERSDPDDAVRWAAKDYLEHYKRVSRRGMH
jgi:hypothetical protein